MQSALPEHGSHDVAIASDIVVILSEAVRPSTVSLVSVVLAAGSSKVDGEISLIGDNVLSFDPDDSLDFDTVYTLTVTPPLADLAGNLLDPWVSNFETDGVDGSDTTAGIGDGTAGATYTGGSGSDAGASVAMLPDVNNDGFDDFIYGSPSDESGSGTATLYFGGSDALSGGGLASLEFVGESGLVYAGTAVAHAGNLDNDLDGIDDFVITAPNPDAPATSSKLFVVFGDADLATVSSPVDLGTITACGVGDPVCGTVFHVDKAEVAGIAVAYAGDVNHDGKDDLMIGAPGASPSARTGAGTVYVIFGPISRGVTIDLLNVGGTVPGLVFHGETAGDNAGRSVSLWEDTDLGTDDLIIGAPGAVTLDEDGVPIGDGTGETTGYVYAIHDDGANLDTLDLPLGSGVLDLSRVARTPDEIPGVVYLGTDIGG